MSNVISEYLTLPLHLIKNLSSVACCLINEVVCLSKANCFILSETNLRKILDSTIDSYGDFDFCAEKASMEIKKAFPDREIKRFYITPYIDDSHRERLNDMEKRFDGTIYPPLETVPLKYAISKRNEWMIDQADMVVSGVTHDWGGAAKTLKYAERKKKRVISI